MRVQLFIAEKLIRNITYEKAGIKNIPASNNGMSFTVLFRESDRYSEHGMLFGAQVKKFGNSVFINRSAQNTV